MASRPAEERALGEFLAARPAPSALLVDGEAGIGKTTLSLAGWSGLMIAGFGCCPPARTGEFRTGVRIAGRSADRRRAEHLGRPAHAPADRDRSGAFARPGSRRRHRPARGRCSVPVGHRSARRQRPVCCSRSTTCNGLIRRPSTSSRTQRAGCPGQWGCWPPSAPSPTTAAPPRGYTSPDRMPSTESQLHPLSSQCT